MNSLKAEFRKLLTVRSTYIITVLITAFVFFIAFYVEGWRLKPPALADTGQLASDVFGALNLCIFGAIVAILLMTHEYRYNTITYTLTSSNSRSKVLAAKIVVVSCFAIFLTVLLGVISPIATYLGIHAAGHELVPQVFHYSNVVWRSLFYGWAYGMFGLVIATIIRVQVGALVTLFIIPFIGEPLLSQLLDKKDVYLPFTAMSQIIGDTSIHGDAVSPAKATMVVCCYLVVSWIITWYLFLKRDAN